MIERNGRLLCSPRNPTQEARDWLLRQKLTKSDQSVLVLGFGGGFHVQELQRQYPHLKIAVVELDQNFHSPDFAFISDPTKQKYDAILAFRPAWAEYEARYLELYLKLTGRDQNPDLQFQNNPNEMKIWQCLRELVK